MSSPAARFLLPSGVTAVAPAGSLIGRLPSAAINIADPRVSEAHALVSLRGGRLKLLALRGALHVAGKVVTEVDLSAGLVVALAEGVELRVVEVVLPDMVLALAGLGEAPLPLVSQVASLVLDPPALVPQLLAEAPAWVWSTADAWMLRVPGEPERALAEGMTVMVGGRSLKVVAMPIRDVGAARTEARGHLYPPMRVTIDFERTLVEADGGRRIEIVGRGADLIYQLMAFEVPTGWKLVARQIWKDKDDLPLRENFDKATQNVRGALTRAGLRPDLVASSGGNVWLRLLEGDTLVDLTRG